MPITGARPRPNFVLDETRRSGRHASGPQGPSMPLMPERDADCRMRATLQGHARICTGHSASVALRTHKTWFGVVLDAPDARELAHFYQRLLGWTIFNESDDWVDLAPSEDAGYNFAFATEKKYARPVWPTVDGEPQISVHLDIEVDDLKQAVAYAVEVGAEEAEYQPQQNVRVLLD